MASVFEMMNNGQMGGIGATGAGGGSNTAPMMLGLLGAILAINVANTMGLQGPQGFGNAPINLLSSRKQPTLVDKFFASLQDGAKQASQNSGIGPATDVGGGMPSAPSGGSWGAYVTQRGSSNDGLAV